MLGLLGYMAGGMAKGMGDAMVKEGLAKREAALKMLDYTLNLDREERSRAFTRERDQMQLAESAKDRDARGEFATDAGGNAVRIVGTEAKPVMGADGKPFQAQRSAKAPTVQRFYDEQTGQEYMAQWDESAGQWNRVGGTKASSDGISVTSPDGTVMRLGGSGKALTEGQSKDTVYATRATGAMDLLDAYGDSLVSLPQSIGGKAPVIGNYIKSDEYQQAEQAGLEFLQAVLRKDTGAAITADEQEQYGRTYLPMPGDGEPVLAQKRMSRIRAVEAIKAGMPPQAILSMEMATRNAENQYGGRPTTRQGAEPSSNSKDGLQDPLGIR